MVASGAGEPGVLGELRRRYPATDELAYFNTAATGLASEAMLDAYRRCLDRWGSHGFDYAAAEADGESARGTVAALIGADAADLALIASVSSAAGLVAAQFAAPTAGGNVVIGEREYSSNHFPWRLLGEKGFEVRQVPFRNGGIEPDDVAQRVDAATALLAFSAVQPSTGHRSDIDRLSEIAQSVGALVFVDGSQLVGAAPVAPHLPGIDVLATADHKYLMHAGRGLGYCYLSKRAQDRFTPINAGWKAGRVPFESFFGPDMELSPTASRFDNSISWVAAIGNRAALAVFEEVGGAVIYDRNEQLAEMVRSSLAEIGWTPVRLPERNRSSIVSVPVVDVDPAQVVGALADRGVVCSARDGNLRVSVHFYNDERDVLRLTEALASL